MKRDITTNDSSYLASPEILPPQAIATVFFRAKYLRESAFLAHLPFAYWLTRLVRPRLFVELGANSPGAGDAVAYFGFCQVIDKLNMDTACYRIAATDSDDDVRDYNYENYDDFSHLFTGDAAGAADRFSDDTVDILLVNLAVTDDILSALDNLWLDRLSPSGVLLLHGVNSGYESEVARAFIQSLKARFATCVFDQGEGLMVVLVGRDHDEQLTKLVGLRIGDTGYSDARLIFRRLGAAHQWEWQSRANDRRLAAQEAKLADLDARLGDSRDQAAADRLKFEELEAAYDVTSAQSADLQTRLSDAEKLAATLRSELDQSQDAHDKLFDERGQLAEANAAHVTRLEALDALCEELRAELATSRHDGEVLAALSHDQAGKIAALTADFEQSQAELEAAIEGTITLSAQITELSDKLEAVETALLDSSGRETALREDLQDQRQKYDTAADLLRSDFAEQKRGLENALTTQAEALAEKDEWLAAFEAAEQDLRQAIEARDEQVLASQEKYEALEQLIAEMKQSHDDELLARDAEIEDLRVFLDERQQALAADIARLEGDRTALSDSLGDRFNELAALAIYQQSERERWQVYVSENEQRLSRLQLSILEKDDERKLYEQRAADELAALTAASDEQTAEMFENLKRSEAALQASRQANLDLQRDIRDMEQGRRQAEQQQAAALGELEDLRASQSRAESLVADLTAQLEQARAARPVPSALPDSSGIAVQEPAPATATDLAEAASVPAEPSVVAPLSAESLLAQAVPEALHAFAVPEYTPPEKVVDDEIAPQVFSAPVTADVAPVAAEAPSSDLVLEKGPIQVYLNGEFGRLELTQLQRILSVSAAAGYTPALYFGMPAWAESKWQIQHLKKLPGVIVESEFFAPPHDQPCLIVSATELALTLIGTMGKGLTVDEQRFVSRRSDDAAEQITYNGYVLPPSISEAVPQFLTMGAAQVLIVTKVHSRGLTQIGSTQFHYTPFNSLGSYDNVMLILQANWTPEELLEVSMFAGAIGRRVVWNRSNSARLLGKVIDGDQPSIDAVEALIAEASALDAVDPAFTAVAPHTLLLAALGQSPSHPMTERAVTLVLPSAQLA